MGTTWMTRETKQTIPELMTATPKARRPFCRVANCPNQVYARQLCVSHGGQWTCQEPDWVANARAGGLCRRHGEVKNKFCSSPGCTKLVYAHRKRARHGGRRPCKVEGCGTHARKGGYCRQHLQIEQKMMQQPTTIMITATAPLKNSIQFLLSSD